MILNDFRTAFRSLRRSPLFVVVATLTLGIGIGLTTTMLSMLDAIRHPYVPYESPEQLFGVTAYGGGTSGAIGPYDKQWAVTEGARSFESITSATVRYDAPIIADGREVLGDVVTTAGNYFSVVSARAEIGRVLNETGDESNAVIGYGFWQRAFASRSLKSGLDVTVRDRTYRVVGVMPREMRSGEISGRYASVFVPMPAGVRGGPIVRLGEGVSQQAAYAELAVIASRLKAVYGEGRLPFQFRMDPLQPEPRVLTDYQKALGSAAFAILLIACANLANLMLVRGLTRKKELSLRLALGAGRGALVRQLLAEGALVGSLGGLVGTVLSVWGIAIIRFRLPVEGATFGFLPPHLNWSVFAIAIAATLGSVLLFALGPAVAASRVRLNEPLKETAGTTSRRTRRVYALVVIGELALCLVLLMGSGLLLRAATRAARFDFGYESSGLLVSFVNPRVQRTDSGATARFQEVLEGVARGEGVRGVTTFSQVPIRGGAVTSDIEGAEPRFVNSRTYQLVGWNFLRTLGVPVVRGRDFEPGDAQGQNAAAIVSEETARALWSGLDPVGRSIKLGNPDGTESWIRVVGVARQMRFAPFDNTTDFIETPIVLVIDSRPIESSWILARVEGNREAAATRLNQVVRGLLPPRGAFTMPFNPWLVMWERQTDGRVALARLFGVFGLLAVTLAAIGLYGVLAYAVGQRMREFAVRIAIGAVARDLRRLVLRDAAIMILGGTAVGGFLAMAGSHFLDFWLFDVPPTDAVSLVGAEVALLLVAFLACMAPARRAANADPLQIVRAL